MAPACNEAGRLGRTGNGRPALANMQTELALCGLTSAERIPVICKRYLSPTSCKAFRAYALPCKGMKKPFSLEAKSSQEHRTSRQGIHLLWSQGSAKAETS